MRSDERADQPDARDATVSASGYIGFELPKGTYLASVTYRPIGVGLDPKYISWVGRY
jgi:hypothetical protein